MSRRGISEALGGFPPMMGLVAHRQLRKLVTAYVDGQLDPASAARAERHLQRCWWCSQDAEFNLLIKQALRRQARRHPDLGAARLRRWATHL